MPIYNFTIDDISPVFIYSAGWIDTNTHDQSFAQYLNETFHATPKVGSSVNVSFNGSAVWVGGAKRGNHGNYNVTLDGQTGTFNGFASPDLFQVTLFSQQELGNDSHVVTLSDVGTSSHDTWFDVDFITFTTGDGTDATVLSDTTFDDSDLSIKYSQGWTTLATQETYSYFNQTSHTTDVPGAEAEITFDGSAIAVYGATNITHGPFAVSLDGGESQMFSGKAASFRPRTLLYYASNLPNATHVLRLVNLGTAPCHNVFDLDFAVVSQYTAPVAAPTAEAISRSNRPRLKGTIAGSILAVAIVLVASLFLVLRWRRRRHALFFGTSRPAVTPSDDSSSTSVPWIDSPGGKHPRDAFSYLPNGMFPAIQTWSRRSQGLAAPSADDARSRPSEYLAGSEADSILERRTRLDSNSIPPPVPSLRSVSTPYATAGSTLSPVEKRQTLYVNNPSDRGTSDV